MNASNTYDNNNNNNDNNNDAPGGMVVSIEWNEEATHGSEEDLSVNDITSFSDFSILSRSDYCKYLDEYGGNTMNGSVAESHQLRHPQPELNCVVKETLGEQKKDPSDKGIDRLVEKVEVVPSYIVEEPEKVVAPTVKRSGKKFVSMAGARKRSVPKVRKASK
jgi:hypothetical protein